MCRALTRTAWGIRTYKILDYLRFMVLRDNYGSGNCSKCRHDFWSRRRPEIWSWWWKLAWYLYSEKQNCHRRQHSMQYHIHHRMLQSQVSSQRKQRRRSRTKQKVLGIYRRGCICRGTGRINLFRRRCWGDDWILVLRFVCLLLLPLSRGPWKKYWKP